MKRYYTVKEASILLGLSTNTIYEYLKQGRLISRRIGRGRFKIPYASLAPFIDSQVLLNSNIESGNDAASAFPGQAAEAAKKNKIVNENLVEVQNNIEQPGVLTGYDMDNLKKKNSRKNNRTQNISGTKLNDIYDISGSGNNQVGVNINDIVFYKLFKALVLIGLGIIYLFTKQSYLSTFDVFGSEIDGVLLKLLPFLLMLAGFFALASVLYYHQIKLYQDRIHVFTAFTLGYYGLLAAASGNYGLLVFLSSLLGVTILHFFTDKKITRDFTFFSQSIKYSIFLALLFVVIIIFYPHNIPFENILLLIQEYKGWAVVIWCGLLIPILISLYRSNGQNKLLLNFVFTLGGIVAIIIATKLTFKERWDVSYLSLMTGLFALLLVAWHRLNIKIEISRLHIVVLAFVWISSSILFGLFAIEYSQAQIKEQHLASIKKNLERTVNQLNILFEQQGALLIASSIRSEVKSAILSGNQTAAMQEAVDLYNKVSVAQRVIVYNSEGIAIAVYPHASLGLGTNFSSREYFQTTRQTFKGQISNVFESVTGTYTIMQTEPVFDGNEFVGMIGIALSLDKISAKYQAELGEISEMIAVDQNGVVAFATDKGIIGLQKDYNELQKNMNSFGSVGAMQTNKRLGWNIYVSSSTSSLFAGVSNLNLLVVLLVVVNAVLSIGTALVLAFKSKNLDDPNAGPLPLSLSKSF